MPRKKSEGVRKGHTGSGITRAHRPAISKKSDAPVPDSRVDFPIVGIGASAGGLEAFQQFFTHMPPDTGMAFVVIQHLDPTHKSILTELVQRYTSMKVLEVEDGVTVQPNTIYIIPPNHYLAILHGKLHLMEPTAPPGLRTPIDFFFRSLAEDRKEKGICIVLSGTGTEGALGLRAIKGEGGMGMVQEPASAKYDGMPRSAVATGLADYVTPVDKIPEQLIAYVRQVFGKEVLIPAQPPPKEKSLLEKVLIILRSHTGHDFSDYKPNTILRRIERRMAVNRIATMSGYLRHLQEYPTEAQTLFKELLIGVTNFFRDPDAFKVLQAKVIPKILENRKPDNPVRIWVAGCSTGEEAYSMAILVRECMDGLRKELTVQVFATDIDSGAIETARTGLYPKSIAVDVPAEILTRYFQQEQGSYRVKKNIRDMVVFALQNVIADPPFSKTDLISCRNLLIYLGPEVQKKLLSLFHYSLKNDGILFLGSSETIGEFTDLFSALERKWKIYSRKDAILRPGLTRATNARGLAPYMMTAQDPGQTKMNRGVGYRDVSEKVLLERYGPAGVLINEKGAILYVHGRTGKYLEMRSGEFSGNIVGMARQGLKLELAAALRDAVTKKEEVRHDKLRVKTNGEAQLVNLIVSPITEPSSMKGLFMVIFEDVPEEEKPRTKRKKSVIEQQEQDPRIRELEQELRSSKEYLQTTIEELETANEELKSTNEELQSTNEELETSKEELQSVNEELVTVNSELEQKMHEFSKASNDMENLLSSTDVGTIFLDTGLNIQRFTPAMTKFINLLPTDVGRPVSHIAPKMDYLRLPEDALQVLKTLIPKQEEVWTRDRRCFTMRILPYRTVENVIDGVVVTFMDITERKIMETKVREALRYSETMVNTVREALVVLDEDLRVTSTNRSFHRTFNLTQEQTEGKLLYDLDGGKWDIPELRELLEVTLPECKVIEGFDLTYTSAGSGECRIIVNARRSQGEPVSNSRTFLAIEVVGKDKKES